MGRDEQNAEKELEETALGVRWSSPSMPQGMDGLHHQTSRRPKGGRTSRDSAVETCPCIMSSGATGGLKEVAAQPASSGEFFSFSFFLAFCFVSKGECPVDTETS